MRAVSVLLLLVCAGPAAATDWRAADRALAEAREAVATAERADAATWARVEFLAAQDELAHAERARAAYDWHQVGFSAKRTVADAAFAIAAGRRARAEADARALEGSVSALRLALNGDAP